MQMKFATGYQPAALNAQRAMGLMLTLQGVFTVINPEIVAEYLLNGSGAQLELYGLISLWGAHILLTGLLIMTGVWVRSSVDARSRTLCRTTLALLTVTLSRPSHAAVIKCVRLCMRCCRLLLP